MNWPGFSVMSNAWWLALLGPLLIFYFLKLKRPEVEISSLVLWQSVLNDQRVNSPFQRFRRNILLWLQITALVLLVVASMQPFLQGAVEPAAYQPILIDCSASMAAIDPVTGKTRLDEARERAGQLVENLRPDQRLALIAIHSSADRLTEFTSNRRVLSDALESLQVRDVSSEIDDALRMTQALSRTVPIESALLISDGNFPRKVQFALPFGVNYQQLPPAGPNAGITAFNARLVTDRSWDVFLRVEASSDSHGRLILSQDGQPTGEQPFVLARGESQRLTFQVTAESSTRLEARLEFGSLQFDSLDADNQAVLDLPVARPLRVFATPTLASFRRVLELTPGIDLYPKAGQPEQRSVDYDLVISEQSQDTGLSASVRLMAGVIPDAVDAMVEPDARLSKFLDWDRTAPLLRHVQLGDVEILESVSLTQGMDAGDLEAAGFSVLATGTAGPLILRQRSATNLDYYLMFPADRSTLEFRVAFPVLVANVVQLARQQAGIGRVGAVSTGVLPPLKLNSNSDCTVSGPGRFRQTLRVGEKGILEGVSAPRAGVYEVNCEGSEPVSIAANLLSSKESTLQSVNVIEFEEQSVAGTPSRLQSDRPVWSIVALLAFAVFVLEWWFFQRPIRRPSS